MDQPHLIDALDRIAAALGGLTQVWRFDRMATVCHPATGRVTASFAAVAKHYGVSVAICPPRHGNRKGVVEKANHTAAQRWWRTLPDDVTVEAGPGVAGPVLRRRRRHPPAGHRRATRDGRRGHVAATEPLALLPAPFPATLHRRAGRVARRRWWPSAGTATRSHPSWPAHRSRSRHRLGATDVDIATTHRDRDRPPPPRPRRRRRDRPRHRPRHRPGTRRPGRVHRRSPAPPQAAHPTRPPARSRAARRPHAHPGPPPRHRADGEVVIDLARYAASRPRKEHPHMTTHPPTRP